MAKVKYIALLRGVNVSGANKVPMVELRALCEKLGWEDPQTYIQSGNVVFGASGPGAKLGASLEKALESGLGVKVPVVVRSAAEWSKALDANPFEAESAKEPNRVMIVTSKEPLAKGAPERLMEKATLGERIAAGGGALWVHFPEGAGKSKLTPVLFDKACGSPATMRNLNTARKLAEMLAG